ncbi:MAG: hypothetical protein ACJ75S_07020 [Solirubrobacterales bacterium]|jgi:hypothetical protein
MTVTPAIDFTPAGLKQQAGRIVEIRTKAKEDEYDLVAEVVVAAEAKGLEAVNIINGMRELADALEFIDETRTEADELAESLTQPIDEGEDTPVKVDA